MYQAVYYALGFPATLLPVTIGVLNEALASASTGGEHWMTGLLLTSGIVSAIVAFVNPGKKSQVHKDFASRFNSLGNEIDLILSKQKKFRAPADVTLERAVGQLNHLLEIADSK